MEERGAKCGNLPDVERTQGHLVEHQPSQGRVLGGHQFQLSLDTREAGLTHSRSHPGAPGKRRNECQVVFCVG